MSAYKKTLKIYHDKLQEKIVPPIKKPKVSSAKAD